VVPKIGKILTDLGGPDAKLPIYTQVLLNISNFNTSHSIMGHIPGLSAIPLIGSIPNGFFGIIVFGIAIFFGLRYIRTPKGKYKFHALLL
jgi:type II secretory pathway component PulF